MPRLRPDNSEVERLWADNDKAAELLDWPPRYGGLRWLAPRLRGDRANGSSDPANLRALQG